MKKTFETATFKLEFVNRFGETLKMFVDDNQNILVHHNDCNNDFEDFKYFGVNYILNDEESAVIMGFIKMVKEVNILNEKLAHQVAS